MLIRATLPQLWGEHSRLYFRRWSIPPTPLYAYEFILCELYMCVQSVFSNFALMNVKQ